MALALLSSSFMVGLFCFWICALGSMRFVSSELELDPSRLCPNESTLFLDGLRSQCSLAIFPNPPIEVGGNFYDHTLTSKNSNSYTSILFYASWCPFSRSMRSTFDNLSSMFPQIEHVAIEQSSAMPSVFSRYGIHSVPSILMVNQTSRLLYRGPKNLSSLVQFFKKVTGLEPVQFISEDQSNRGSTTQSLNGLSLNDMLTREPYLVFAILFLCLRGIIAILPQVLSRLKAFWDSYIPRLNLEIFGETSQILGRLLHMIDVRRVWTKLRLCKTRNFHEGAMNARVWASSLASVSLGKSSSARL